MVVTSIINIFVAVISIIVASSSSSHCRLAMHATDTPTPYVTRADTHPRNLDDIPELAPQDVISKVRVPGILKL